MFVNIESLGEKTLNKIATIALSKQLNQVESLSVKVKTDPQLLAKGMLESLAIEGKGLITAQRLRMQEMNIKINQISVSPWKALRGNIQLTQPSFGTASVVLTQTDLNRVFQIDPYFQNQPVVCKILPEGKLVIATNYHNQDFIFTVTPQITDTGKGVILDNIQYFQGANLASLLTEKLLAKIEPILNLSSFQIQGISLTVQQLQLETGKLTVSAVANLTQFPTVN